MAFVKGRESEKRSGQKNKLYVVATFIQLSTAMTNSLITRYRFSIIRQEGESSAN